MKNPECPLFLVQPSDSNMLYGYYSHEILKMHILENGDLKVKVWKLNPKGIVTFYEPLEEEEDLEDYSDDHHDDELNGN